MSDTQRSIAKIDRLIDKLQAKRDLLSEQLVKMETKELLDPLFEAMKGIALAPLEIKKMEDEFYGKS